MTCTRCKRSVKRTVEIMEDVPGVGPQKKFLCFQCTSEVAEEEIRLSRKSTCPTCNRESVRVSVNQKSVFEFICQENHSWIL